MNANETQGLGNNRTCRVQTILVSGRAAAQRLEAELTADPINDVNNDYVPCFESERICSPAGSLEGLRPTPVNALTRLSLRPSG